MRFGGSHLHPPRNVELRTGNNCQERRRIPCIRRQPRSKFTLQYLEVRQRRKRFRYGRRRKRRRKEHDGVKALCDAGILGKRSQKILATPPRHNETLRRGGHILQRPRYTHRWRLRKRRIEHANFPAEESSAQHDIVIHNPCIGHLSIDNDTHTV